MAGGTMAQGGQARAMGSSWSEPAVEAVPVGPVPPPWDGAAMGSPVGAVRPGCAHARAHAARGGAQGDDDDWGS